MREYVCRKMHVGTWYSGYLMLQAVFGLCTCGYVRGCVCVYRGCVRLCALAGQSAQYAPLGHLQAGSDGRDSGEGGRQPRHICLHVTQQLLQLVQHCNCNSQSEARETGLL